MYEVSKNVVDQEPVENKQIIKDGRKTIFALTIKVKIGNYKGLVWFL